MRARVLDGPLHPDYSPDAMAKKKKTTPAPKTPRKVKARASNATEQKPKAKAAAPQETPPSPPAPSQPPAPPDVLPAASTPAENSPTLHPAVPMVVSLLAPGLGLLLLKNRDHVKDGFLIFGVWFSYLVVSFVLTFFIVGICCWLPLPLLNVAAGIHSFDEATLEQGGSPLLFQKGFRIFKG